MSDVSFLNVRNMDEIKDALAKVPEKIGVRAIQDALLEASEVMRQEAIHRVPVKSGWLRSMIAKARRRSRNSNEGAIAIGIKKSSGNNNNWARGADSAKGVMKSIKGKRFERWFGWSATPSTYAKFVEFGTKFMPARRFLEDAAAAKAQEVVEIFGRVIGPAIERAVERDAKRKR